MTTVVADEHQARRTQGDYGSASTTKPTPSSLEPHSASTKFPLSSIPQKLSAVIVLSLVVAIITLSLTTESLSHFAPVPSSPLQTAVAATTTTTTTTRHHFDLESGNTTDSTLKPPNSIPTTLEEQNPSDPRVIMRRLLQDRYPECQLPKINLKTMGWYVNASSITDLGTSNSPPAPPYDHFCFIMKARYNCAKRPDAPFQMAHYYELALLANATTTNTTSINATSATTPPTAATARTSRPCRIKALVQDTLKEWQNSLDNPRGNVKKGDFDQKKEPKQHILLQGNSYVRQLWEALVCGISSSRFGGLVSDFAVQKGGPGISLNDFNRRQNRLVDLGELKLSSHPLTNLSYLQQVGCHGEYKSDISAYYRRKAGTVPPNLPGCNDNVAVIELGHAWRFSYIFKPTMYTLQALEYLYQDRLGIQHTPTKTENEDEIDLPSSSSSSSSSSNVLLVWNSVMKEPQNITTPGIMAMVQSPSSNRSFQLNIESWMWDLRDLQLRDLGRYFGANNPWIKNPPDFHACLPGTPDDQVHLLLFWLWSGYEIVV